MQLRSSNSQPKKYYKFILQVYRNLAWRANTGNIAALVSDEEAGIPIDLEQLGRASSREDFSDLSSNSIVVLDEFHYMGQKGRGSV